MIKAVLFDLDGTLYVGRTPIPGAAEKVRELQERGLKVLALTNAATTSRERVSKRLGEMGFALGKGCIYTSAYVLACYIREKLPGKKVLIVGEAGMGEELEETGVEVVESGGDIVAAGLDRKFDYARLSIALSELERGAEFLATNADATYPTERGNLPGAGSIVAAIEAASKRKALIVGKPNPYTLELIMREQGLESAEILMVGDRIETDIRFAKDCGMKSALVLSGASGKKDAGEIVPDYIFDSVAGLDFKDA